MTTRRTIITHSLHVKPTAVVVGVHATLLSSGGDLVAVCIVGVMSASWQIKIILITVVLSVVANVAMRRAELRQRARNWMGVCARTYLYQTAARSETKGCANQTGWEAAIEPDIDYKAHF